MSSDFSYQAKLNDKKFIISTLDTVEGQLLIYLFFRKLPLI